MSWNPNLVQGTPNIFHQFVVAQQYCCTACCKITSQLNVKKLLARCSHVLRYFLKIKILINSGTATNSYYCTSTAVMIFYLILLAVEMSHRLSFPVCQSLFMRDTYAHFYGLEQ
jgi:hypothetical protein